MMTRSTVWAALAAALPLSGCSAGEPDLAASEAWARPTAPGQTSAAIYLRIANQGGSDRLLAVRTPRAAMAMLHSGSMEGGVARMRPMNNGLEVGSGATVRLAPEGDHVMLTGLQAPLRTGERFALTLDFERSPDKHVEVRVLTAGASEAEGHGH